MSSAHPHLPNSQEEAALDSDLSLNQLVLERSQTATKTAEDIKQEELLRRAAEKKNNHGNIGAVPAPAVARRPVANTRKKAPATVTNKAVGTNASEADDQRQKDELALMRVVAERSAAASREEAELAEGASKSNNTVEVGAQAFNPGDYVSEKGDTVNLMTIVAQRSVDDDATPSMAATEDNMAPPDAGGDAVALTLASNPVAGIEYDHQTGRPMTKHSLPPGSVTPGAYSGAPGANYQAVDPVRLDVLGASSPPSQEVPGQIEDAELDTTATLEEKKRNPVVMGAAIAVLVVIIILAIAIPLAVGGGNGESPKMENNQETSIDKVLLPNAPSSTWESIVDDQESPQFKAYTWLTLDPNLQTYENWQKEQRFALATFYYAFNGMKWNILQKQRKWLDYEINECEWGAFYSGSLYNHLSCDNNGRVTMISVKRQIKIQGTIPLEIFLLETLKELNFRNSQLSGMIPSEVGLLLSLTAIDLGHNQLVAEIPSEVGQLTALRSLDLRKNQLSGIIPSEIGLLSALTLLNLTGNQFEAIFPAELGSLPDSADLWGQLLLQQGTIPSEIGFMTRRTSLDWLLPSVSGGSIPSEIGLMTSLTAIEFRRKDLSGSLPSEMGLLTSVTKLRLDGNGFSGSIPTELGLLTNVTSLGLYDNQLSGNLPSELGLLTRLTSLGLYDNQLSGSLPSELGLLTSLASLALYSNQLLSGTIPSELGLLTRLTFVGLYNNQFSGSFPSSLCSNVGLGVYLDCDPDPFPVECSCFAKCGCS